MQGSSHSARADHFVEPTQELVRPVEDSEFCQVRNTLFVICVLFKKFSFQRASSGGGRDSDKALISMAQLISNGLRSAPAKVVAGLLA